MSLYTLTIDLLARTGMLEQGMDKAERITARRAREIERTMTRTGKVIGTALGTGIAVGTAAMAAWSKEVAEIGINVDRLSRIAGASNREFQIMAAGARVYGIEQEKLSDQLKDFRERIGEFIQTGGGEMKDFFEKIAPRIGVTADQFARLSGPKGLLLYVDSLQKAGLSQQEMSFYLESIASDTTALIPLLRDGGRELQAYGREAERLGGILDDKTIAATRELREQLWRADQAFMGFKVRIANEAIPAVNEFAATLNDPAVQDGLANVATGLTNIANVAVRATALIGTFAGEAARGFGMLANGVSQADLDAQKFRIEALQKIYDQLGTGMDLRSDEKLEAERAALRARIAELQAEYRRNVDAFGPKVHFIRPGDKTPESLLKPEVMPLPQFEQQLEDRRQAADRVLKADVDEWEADLVAIQRIWDEAAIDRHNRDVDAWVDQQRSLMREAEAAAEDWRWTVMGSVEGVADVFADLFSGQLKSTRDFFTELKDVWKRGWWDLVRMSMQESFVNPLGRALKDWMGRQGYGAAGVPPGVLMRAGMVAGAPSAAQEAAMAGAGFPGWTTPGAGVGGWGAPGAMGGGSGGFGGGMPSMNMLTGEFAGGMPYASTALGLYGLYYGATQRGNGGLSSGLAGLSYGAAGIGLGGAIAGGLGAIGTGTGLAGMGAGAMGGAKMAMGSAASSIGGAAWIPVVGWILAAAAVVDMVSGGKLFGTKYQANKITQDLGVGPDGGMASMTVNEVRQRSLFRGRKWRDRELDPTDEQRQAAQDLYEAMERVSRSAASQLGLQTVDIVAGSIRQVYNKKGELQSEMSTVLGQTFEESFEDFASRLTSEQLIAAVGQIDSAASKIAQDWRHSAEVLAAGAEFFMTAASDARNGLDLWSGIGLRGLTDFVERMQMGEESLAQAYQRLAGLAGDYGSFMADINTTLMTDGLNSYQQQALQIERTYRQQVKSANDYAKALGLSGARAEDLAKIEELRAVSMGKLRAQMEAENEAFLGQLALSDLSTLRDDQKLSEAMEQFADAVAGGDTQAAQAAAQAALGFGRNLYASGRDYQALYDQVTGQLRGMQPGEGDLDMGGLADELEAMQEGISRAVFELAAQSRRVEAGTDRTNGLLGEIVERLDRIDRNTGGQLEHSRSRDLDDRLNGRRAVMAR